MSFSRTVPGLICAAFLAAGVALQTHAEEANKRIAVVNVARVFNAYQKVQDVQKKMEALFEADKNAIEKEGRELKKTEDALRLNPNDPRKDMDLFKQMQAFELHKMQLQLKYDELSQKVEDKRKEEMKTVLNDIKAAIRAVGTAEKFDLILRAPEFDEDFDSNKAAKPEDKKDEPRSAADLVRRFRENPVMYFSQGVEVTDKVIAKLNDDYKNIVNTSVAPKDK
jgi:Skp family chaperone for outer membrane proteins